MDIPSAREAMVALAERCKPAGRAEIVPYLKEAYQLLYDSRLTRAGAPRRVFDTLVEALAFNEAAILLIPSLCTARVDWHRQEGEPLWHIIYKVRIDSLEDATEIGCCESQFRALAYCGAAMLAHAHILEQESVG